MVVFEDESMVYDANPDLSLLKQLAPYDVIITAASNQYDFVSRYFWPASGGDEDPVTSSAHATLVPLVQGVGKNRTSRISGIQARRTFILSFRRGACHGCRSGAAL